MEEWVDVYLEQMLGIYRVIDPRLLDSPHISTFLLVSFTDFLAFLAIFIPYTFLPPLVQVSLLIPHISTFLLVSFTGFLAFLAIFIPYSLFHFRPNEQ